MKNMAVSGTDFLPLSKQLFARDLGAALSELARRQYGPTGTAKAVAKRWGLDDETAKNLVSKGIASTTTIAKAITAEGWGLWHALGAELTGETYPEFEERRLQSIIKDAEDARENLVALRTRRAAVESSAPQLDASRSWQPASRDRDRHG